MNATTLIGVSLRVAAPSAQTGSSEVPFRPALFRSGLYIAGKQRATTFVRGAAAPLGGKPYVEISPSLFCVRAT